MEVVLFGKKDRKNIEDAAYQIAELREDFNDYVKAENAYWSKQITYKKREAIASVVLILVYIIILIYLKRK